MAWKRDQNGSVERIEDDPLLRGRARFLDDITLPGTLHAMFVRSSVAHALIAAIDAEQARKMPGIHGIFTYKDLRSWLTCDRIPLALPSPAVRQVVDPWPLAKSEVCYVGEPVAVVIAESRAVAEDAAAAVVVEYDLLPCVTDPKAGLQQGSPLARADCTSNLVASAVIQYGNVAAAFESAHVRVANSYRLSKGGGHSLECRGVLAKYDDIENLLTLWDSTQVSHRIKAVLVAALGLREDMVRVVAPGVGGGFGPKAVFHPEELVVPVVSMMLRRPVKWVEDRIESFSATCQEHDQIWDMEVAFDAQGRLLAIRGKLFHDHGACTPYGVALPYNAATNLIGPYALPAYELEIVQCITNMVPATPTRGAGRPQGTFVMERLLDLGAEKLGLEQSEIRARNLIPHDKMPYSIPVIQRDGAPMTYDSGNYPACQAKALELAGWRAFKQRQAEERLRGRWLGIGLCNYVEATGRGPYETVSVRIGQSGAISVATGATAQGQGIGTMLAQVVGDALGMPARNIRVVCGDTASTIMGLGAFGSRQAVTAGNAAHIAARQVAEKVRKAAAELMEADPEDIELKNGFAFVKGVPQIRKSLSEIATMLAGLPGYSIPGGLSPGLASTIDFEPRALTYTNGAHVAEVEVDIETGGVEIRRYTVVHDCGTMINPMMVEGQVLGGVVHGAGSCLLEWMRFSDNGQPLTTTYGDYVLPSADSVEHIVIEHMVSPTPLNPLGVKGAAESGTIGAPAAITGAIQDALRPLGIHFTSLPLTPPVVAEAIKRARRAEHAP